MGNKFRMTPAGHASLLRKLKRLKEVDRPANARAIEVARDHGEENPDYVAAKEEKAAIEASIRDCDERLALAVVIDPAGLSGNRVQFGATVTIEDLESGDSQTYTIVGEHEANIKRRRISQASPTARQLLDKRVDDEVSIVTPRGRQECKIVNIEWLPVDDED